MSGNFIAALQSKGKYPDKIYKTDTENSILQCILSNVSTLALTRNFEKHNFFKRI